LKSGRIYYGGYDLNVIDLRYLRKQIGSVFQDSLPPVGEILEILAGDNLQISESKVWAALEKTGIADAIKGLPLGLHTQINASGLSISGQRQILLAKLLLQKYKFLFLDEAFNQFDRATRQRIFMDIKNTSATKIIITHNHEIAKLCDKIIILEDGGIKASGTYEEVRHLIE
jgi:ABC-type bacteriocin/lantibiotic exporter with double-glycine peptidase domain